MQDVVDPGGNNLRGQFVYLQMKTPAVGRGLCYLLRCCRSQMRAITHENQRQPLLYDAAPGSSVRSRSRANR